MKTTFNILVSKQTYILVGLQREIIDEIGNLIRALTTPDFAVRKMPKARNEVIEGRNIKCHYIHNWIP